MHRASRRLRSSSPSSQARRAPHGTASANADASSAVRNASSPTAAGRRAPRDHHACLDVKGRDQARVRAAMRRAPRRRTSRPPHGDLQHPRARRAIARDARAATCRRTRTALQPAAPPATRHLGAPDRVLAAGRRRRRGRAHAGVRARGSAVAVRRLVVRGSAASSARWRRPENRVGAVMVGDRRLCGSPALPCAKKHGGRAVHARDLAQRRLARCCSLSCCWWPPVTGRSCRTPRPAAGCWAHCSSSPSRWEAAVAGSSSRSPPRPAGASRATRC